jgi:hypothetical protein
MAGDGKTWESAAQYAGTTTSGHPLRREAQPMAQVTFPDPH